MAEKGRDRAVFPGDDLLVFALFEATDAIDIAAPPAGIWPWLVQMGCRRGGFYSIDALDNGGKPSARAILPECQTLAVGDVIPATPTGNDGFEVLGLEAPHVMVLGSLVDLETRRQLPFASARPAHYWHSTWAFCLEPIDERRTRLSVRARGVCSRGDWWRIAWIVVVHKFMQHAQLRHLAARAERRGVYR